MLYDKIQLVVRKNDGIEYVERYRSGHNEAVLKTVCPRGRVGSNPTLSALKLLVCATVVFYMSCDM